MSASHLPALSAVAFQLAARLETYEADVARMLCRPTDPELYQKVSQHMDEMRLYAASLPSLSVAWVEVLIRHFELTHGLWRAQDAEEGPAGLAQLHAQHRDAVSGLARKCTQLIAAL